MGWLRWNCIRMWQDGIADSSNVHNHYNNNNYYYRAGIRL